jgi:hypothetical protein
MAKNEQPCDVFISGGRQGAKFAAEVARVMQANDLAVYRDQDAEPVKRLGDAAWDAMAESRALVIVSPKGELNDWMIFHLGGAMTWHKPVYVVVDDPAPRHLAPDLPRLPIYSRSRLEEIAQTIKTSEGTVGESDLPVLVEEFERLGEPIDALAADADKQAKLARQFNKRTRQHIVPEELLRTLLRLRKRGYWPTTPKRGGHKVA